MTISQLKKMMELHKIPTDGVTDKDSAVQTLYTQLKGQEADADPEEPDEQDDVESDTSSDPEDPAEITPAHSPAPTPAPTPGATPAPTLSPTPWFSPMPTPSLTPAPTLSPKPMPDEELKATKAWTSLALKDANKDVDAEKVALAAKKDELIALKAAKKEASARD